MNTVYNCKVCDKVLSGKQRSFCSVTCKNNFYQDYEELKKRAFERKSRLIDVFGGGCNRCGYTSIEALSFYNHDASSLHVDTTILANSSYEKLLKRVENAQLLCRNCVEEVQNTGQLDSWLVTRNDKVSDLDLLKNFNENLCYCGVKQRQTIVLGVSGGVDSITMLDLFAKANLELDIIVAHMNHGIRSEAVKDEDLVRKLAKKHGYKFISKTITKPSIENLENSLRDSRREFLLDTAKISGSSTLVALAHNEDDQAETFIMHAVRGSGAAGLGGMSMAEGNIIRPILNMPRAEILSYAKTNTLTWHEDITNRDTSYDRNYIRHRILPLLGRLNPGYLSAIHRTTYLQRRIDEHIKEEAYRVINNYKSPSTKQLRRLDKPLLYEVLGLLYEEVKGDRENLSLGHLQDVEQLIQSDKGTRALDLPGEIIVRRSYDKLDFYDKKAHNVPSTPSTIKLKVGAQKFGDWKITISNQQSATNNKHTLNIAADILPHLIVRTRKPGDQIHIIGMGGRKKLQDLFVDAKIDRWLRDSWPVLVNTELDQILWVPGLAKAKIDTKNKELLIINIVEVSRETIEKK